MSEASSAEVTVVVEETTSSTCVGGAEGSPSSLSSASGAGSSGGSPAAATSLGLSGVEEGAEDATRAEPVSPPSPSSDLLSLGDNDEAFQEGDDDRDPWLPISVLRGTGSSSSGGAAGDVCSPAVPLEARLGDVEEEDVFGDRELAGPGSMDPLGDEVVSCDEEEEELLPGLPRVATPRRLRRLSSSSSGSPPSSPRPVFPSAESTCPPREEAVATSPEVVPPAESRRRRRRRGATREPTRRVRPRLDSSPPRSTEVALPGISSPVVPPSSPAAIVTVPGSGAGPMISGVASLYRAAVRRLLRSPPVARSRRSGEEDPESEPDSDDGWLMSAVTSLEAYRTRPSSRFGSGQSRLVVPRVPGSLSQLLSGVDHPYRGPWERIPAGFVSEWFPVRPREDSTGCTACQETRDREERIRRETRSLWREELLRNAGTEVSGRGAFSWVDRSVRPQLWIPLALHSCELGDEVHFPVVLLSSGNLSASLPGPGAFGVQLRIFLHFGVPSGLIMQWRSHGVVRMVFPLAGMLRRYWGRAALVEGTISVTGTASTRRAGVEVVASLSLSVAPRFPGLLQYFPLQVAGTVFRGYRSDLALLGASFRWMQPRRVMSSEEAQHPQTVAQADLLEALLSEGVVLSSWAPVELSASSTSGPAGTEPATDGSQHGHEG